MAATIDLDRIEAKIDGPLPIIVGTAEAIDIRSIIDQATGVDKGKRIVSPGTAGTAMIGSILSNRKALYRVDETYAESDTEKLFGAGIEPKHLNDDTLGRALDAIYDANPKKLYSEVVLNAIRKYGIPIRGIHCDTT